MKALASDDGAERAVGQRHKLRTLLAAADADPLIEKYGFMKRFEQN